MCRRMILNTSRRRTTTSSNGHESIIRPLSNLMIDLARDQAAGLSESEPMPDGAGEPAYSISRKDSETGSDLLEVAMGPQHPSTHGVFRMDVMLDGETVVKLKPVFGYLHRNHEQIGEQSSYLGSMPYTDRLDYFCSLTNNWAYALTIEKLAGLQPPERAEYI